jgi:hypothetical protein
LQELPTSVGQLNAFEKLDLGRGCAWGCKNYIHLLANWMHSKSFIYWVKL